MPEQKSADIALLPFLLNTALIPGMWFFLLRIVHLTWKRFSFPRTAAVAFRDIFDYKQTISPSRFRFKGFPRCKACTWSQVLVVEMMAKRSVWKTMKRDSRWIFHVKFAVSCSRKSAPIPAACISVLRMATSASFLFQVVGITTKESLCAWLSCRLGKPEATYPQKHYHDSNNPDNREKPSVNAIVMP